jgi:hypothetical protein
MQKNISENEIFEEIKKKAEEYHYACMSGESTAAEILGLMKEIKKLVKEGNLLSFEADVAPTGKQLEETGMVKIYGGCDVPLIILPPGSKSISTRGDKERIRLPNGKIIKFISGDSAYLYGYFAF